MKKQFKNVVISVLVFTLVAGCMFSKNRAVAEEDKLPTDDSCSGYLFGRPTDEQIRIWSHKSDSLWAKRQLENDREPGIYKTKECLRAINSLSFAFEEKENLDLRDSIIFWALSEFMPIFECPSSEYRRFKLLNVQIDSLLKYDYVDYYFNISDWLGMSLTFKKTECRELFRRLVQSVDDNLKQMLCKEQAQFEAYNTAFGISFEILEGCDSAWSNVFLLDALGDNYWLWHRSLESFYFNLKDGIYFEYDVHEQFPLSLIEKEYYDWINSLKESEYESSRIERKKCLLDDKREFQKWMIIRDQISEMLCGKSKTVYDNATNEIRRRKLVMLKNHYLGYGVVGDELLESILSPSCTDEELLNFKLPEVFCF